jgi:hypothetical protein
MTWTSRERDLVRRHYGPLSREPWPTARIAAMLGRTRKVVASFACRMGWCYGGTWRPLTAWDFRRCYRKGYSDARAARELCCTRGRVRNWRRARGLPPLGRGGRKAA